MRAVRTVREAGEARRPRAALVTADEQRELLDQRPRLQGGRPRPRCPSAEGVPLRAHRLRLRAFGLGTGESEQNAAIHPHAIERELLAPPPLVIDACCHAHLM
jgi:hypothetical protein